MIINICLYIDNIVIVYLYIQDIGVFVMAAYESLIDSFFLIFIYRSHCWLFVYTLITLYSAILC